MIASALPDAPRGSPGRDDASGFRGLLAALLSPDGDEGASSSDTPPVLAGAKAMDSEAEPQVLPGAADGKVPEPQVLPGTPAHGDGEPLVLPIAVEAKTSEPEILPDSPPAKDAGPLVLPGAPSVKGGEPQVLPDAAGDKSPKPQFLATPLAPKVPQPQILPGTGSAEAAPPVVSGEDAAGAASPGSTTDPVRPGAGPTPAALSQPVPPPLRTLAERTSKPLDETSTAPSPSAGDAKTTAPTTSSVATSASQSSKPDPQAVQTAPSAQTDRAGPAPDEGSSAGGSAGNPAEAAAPARDHSLSTLSRASIDATAQIAAQIQRRLEGRSTRFEIALRPAELGRVDVKLDIDAEGRLAARLAFDNPAAATDLRGRVDDLRRQLEAAGFELADDAFEFAERDSGSSAFDRGHDARHGQNRAFAAAARLKTEIDIAQPPQWLALSLSPSGVDLKV